MSKIIQIKNIENTKNKVDELNDSVTDEQYPSAKAVYRAIQEVSNDLNIHKIDGGRITDVPINESKI